MTYVPLEKELKPWFERRLEELPIPLRRRVELEFRPLPWNDLSPAHRRKLVRQIDYDKDPNIEPHREYWFDFYEGIRARKEQLAEWRLLKPQTPTDKALQEDRVVALSGEIDHMQRLEKLWLARSFPQHEASAADDQLSSPMPTSTFLALPKTLRILDEKFGATAEELAAWVYMGPAHGGIRAFCPIRKGKEAARFFFEPEMSADYVSELLGCHFLEEEINCFVPRERYITGKALKLLWSGQLGERTENWITQFIAQDQLIELHPTRGAVSADRSMIDVLPPLDTGLYPLDQVRFLQESVLDVDFPIASSRPRETAAARKARLELWFQEEVQLRGKRGALTRTAEREGITTQTLRKILNRPKR